MTMKLEQAARQIIVDWDSGIHLYEAITALREALGNSLKPKCFADYQPNHAIDRACASCPVAAECQTGEQAEQEPVAWAHWKSPDYAEDPAFLVTVTEKPTGWQTQSANWFPLYAAPVRTKDLTDDEVAKAYMECTGGDIITRCRAVIAADREKNR